MSEPSSSAPDPYAIGPVAHGPVVGGTAASGSVAGGPVERGPVRGGPVGGGPVGGASVAVHDLPTTFTPPSVEVVGEAAPSWEDVATRYGPTIYTMAYRLTGDRDEARDLTQDVFVRVYRNIDRYQPGTFEGWLYRITKNLFLDRVRRGGRVRLEPLPEEEWRQPAEPTPGPAEQLEEGVLRGDLQQALQGLPGAFRTAVVLCDVQGLTYEEIAAATGWPIGTVRSRIHRGRRMLRRQLDEPRPSRRRRG